MKIFPVHNGLVRLKTYTIKEIFSLIQTDENHIILDEYVVNIKRAKIFFKKGIVCTNCGLRGEFFALNKDRGESIHLDLYGYQDDEEVCLTIDHIIPKSKGGRNILINFQVMCKVCNEMKSDYMPE